MIKIKLCFCHFCLPIRHYKQKSAKANCAKLYRNMHFLMSGKNWERQEMREDGQLGSGLSISHSCKFSLGPNSQQTHVLLIPRL